MSSVLLDRGRLRASLAITALIGIAVLPAVAASGDLASAAPGDQSVFVDESFAGPSVGDAFIAPSVAEGVNVACLTAGTDPIASPIPGCGTDAAGSGVLRLTEAVGGQTGGVGSTASVPISKGLDVSFDSYQWGGTLADGMTLYLAATDPFAPEVPTMLGALGGSLGYSAQGTVPGLANGYLGIGLDFYGNFAVDEFGGSGCAPGPGFTPNGVTVRGPGNGTVGYCLLDATALAEGSLRGGGDRSTARVPVEVVINPSASQTITARENSDVLVAPGRYAVIVQPVGGALQVFDGPLPSVGNGLIPAGLYDPSWIDPATGYPYKLTFGWTGGTGGQHDFHEVANARATTALGATPALEAAMDGEEDVVPTRSSQVTISSSLSSDSGTEDEPITATATFPAGFAPSASTSAGWVCTIAGQQQTCTYDAPGTLFPGDPLPPLVLPYTVAAGAASGAIDAVVSSIDATSAAVSLAIAVAKDPTSLVASASQQPGATGERTVFRAVVDAPVEAPSGTITVTDQRTSAELCTAPLVAQGSAASAEAVCVADLPGGAAAADVLVTYSGDDAHAASSASPAAITETITPTEIALTAEIGTDGTVSFDVTGLTAGATGAVVYSANGAVLCTATLPDTSCTATLPPGVTVVSALYGGDAVFSASADALAVAVPSAPSEPVAPAEPAAGSGLPVTGADALPLLGAALALLAIGAAILVIARRSRSTHARR